MKRGKELENGTWREPSLETWGADCSIEISCEMIPLTSEFARDR